MLKNQRYLNVYVSVVLTCDLACSDLYTYVVWFCDHCDYKLYRIECIESLTGASDYRQKNEPPTSAFVNI